MALLCEYTELQYNRDIIAEAMDVSKPLVLHMDYEKNKHSTAGDGEKAPADKEGGKY